MSKVYRRNEAQYLKAADVPKETKVKITKFEEIKRNDGRIGQIIHLKGYDKVLDLNATNLNVLIDKLGDDSDLWAGKDITLFKVKTENPDGDPVDGIRLK